MGQKFRARNDFDLIKAKLGRFLSADEIPMWLEQPHFLLRGQTPDNFIRAGRAVEVQRLIALVFDHR